MLLSTGSNETTAANASTFSWDDLDSLWPDHTPFNTVWYSVLLFVLYSVVFTAGVVGKSFCLSLLVSLIKSCSLHFTIQLY